MEVSAEHLKEVGIALLGAAGVGPEEAVQVAESLVAAEMRGVPTHGVNLLPTILERIEAGLIEIPTELKVIADQEAVTHIDGGNGLGQVAAAEGMRRSIAKARRFGVGFSLVRNTNNNGLLAYYSLMAAKEGMIGVCMCNGAASMAPWGGAQPFFGSNPLSVAAPGGAEPPVVLDMSTSVVARGKIRRAARMKERIPLGWALDETGAPTDDPEAAIRGTLAPIAEYKGYDMAFFIDLICGLLSGSCYARGVRAFHKPEGPTGVGVMTMAIDTGRFMQAERYAALVEEHAGAIRASTKAKGSSRIYLPGEIEAERERLSRERGVEVDRPVWRAIDCLLERMGLPVRLGDGAL